MPGTVTGEDAEAVALDLLDRRAAGATICPSEVARAIAAAAGRADWRGEMGAVHAAVDRMVAQGLVRLSWKGAAMPAREGPYRIGRAGPDEEDRDYGRAPHLHDQLRERLSALCRQGGEEGADPSGGG